MRKFLAIDVGGTYIKYALMDEEANIQEQGQEPTPRTTLEDFVDVIGGLYDKYEGQIEAIVMAAPGRIDAGKGYFYTSGALKYIGECDMAGLLRERCPITFTVENDAKAAALAELWKGSMKGVKNGIVMTLGTGIGGALIINGALYRGTTFAAGEFSGISTMWEETYDSHKSWSNSQSTSGLVKRYADLKYVPYDSVNGHVFFERANAGEEEALEILDRYCTGLATGIYSLQLAFDAQKVAIGGGISKQPILIETLNRKMDEIFASDSCRHTPATRPEIVACEFGNDANLIGALYHYRFEYGF